MDTQMELAKNRLFGPDGLKVTNIKLYPGANRDSTPDNMAEVINRVLSQIEAGISEPIVDVD